MAELKFSRMAALRRSRAMMAPKQLKTQAVFWLAAVAIGVVSAGFSIAADFAQHVFAHATQGGWTRWLPLAITPLGFMVCAWAAMRFFPGAQGSGIPQAMASRALREIPGRGGLLSLRLAAGKIVLTVLGLFCGASIGREGPTVQIGASIMLAAGEIGNVARMRGLILAGSAAGIAAAFNTPIAGIVFAIEEMGRSFQARTNGVVLLTVIIAGAASLMILGNYTYFGASLTQATSLHDWGLIVACGLFGGVMGALFSNAVLFVTKRLRQWRAVSAWRKVLIISGVAGVVTAVTGLLCGGETWGTGYTIARHAIEGQAPGPLFFLGKLIATLAATLSGIPGGLFAPSLSVGAGLGAAVATVLGGPVALAAVVGMAGYFSGVTQAPLTTIVIIVEMTGNHLAIGPVMVASMLGFGVARVISSEPLYATQARFFVADALRRHRSELREEEERDAQAASRS